jgi:hypothetical protein
MCSDFDGEALAAAREADKLIRDRGLTWSDVLPSWLAFAPPQPPPPPNMSRK